MSGAAAAGFYGKLPARGDFVERRLDRGFCRAIDGWLQAGMETAQVQLGESWLPLYLEAPIWRFALAAGVCGPRPAMGVMMSSVDRVGRYFPLVVATHSASVPADAWFDAAEQLVLTALEDDCTFEAFDSCVAAMAPAAPACVPDGASGSLWWTLGSAALPACALTSPGLPVSHECLALLDADVGRWGWQRLAKEPVPGMPAFGLS
jgi:type VI secretion system protein ImpM